jgi:sigma-B regulation protein RsbQ
MSLVALRHNVTVTGRRDGRPLLFAHGFGCDQSMWRTVARRFEDSHAVVLFDLMGFGGSDASEYADRSYSSLDDYATDVLELCEELDLRDVTYVGHSVSAMIGVLAANREPDRFASMVLVAPSPRYLDDDGYRGGFEREDIDSLLETMEADYLGWSAAMAPAIMGTPGAPELGDQLTESFCRVDPRVARDFARLTFLSDNREDLERLRMPTLILQCSQDILAPVEVGTFVHDRVAGSQLVVLDATGHCPNVSAPDETERAIRAFV